MGPSDGHPYSLLLDLTQLLIILHEQQSPKLSTAFQTVSSVEELPWPAGCTFLNVAQYCIQVHRETAPCLIFTLAPTVVPGTSSRAVSQAATFQLYLCVRLFFPRCRALWFCLLSFGNSCCSSSQVPQDCCELKPYRSVHQLFLHLVLSSHFPGKCILPYDPWWRWGTMSDPEQTPWFSLCYWLPAGLWAIDYCEPSVQAIFNISNSSVSPQFLSFMSFWGRLCQKPKCIIPTALPWSMQLIISSQKAIGLVTDGLHLVNLCWVFPINFFSFTFLKIYSLLS